ncbi:ABC transporter permease [Xanthobacter aminoxidans]|uniref:ABC transporter permease n=1 Tax=Xanthobacter aminoxidans TaxID=186280 RepID=UPI002022EA5E|nr:ABC transporter permease subunit [Xanthobacter aminoxidans]MCL8382372.1 ABC transporter permease subunit [Xanthobacter aminoxidans]
MAAPARTLSPALLSTLWGAAGLLALAGAWQWGAAAFGPFVLPSLAETGEAVVRLVTTGKAGPALLATLVHALAGCAAGGAAGFFLGVAGGLVLPVGAMSYPVFTALLGTPPIAWVVLALLWFGPGGAAATFTVAITVAPILFIATLQGVRSRDRALAEMAQLYRAPALMRFTDLVLPALADFLIPAVATALAFSFKVAVMAEVLSGADGVGGGIATARSHFDLPETMAWIVLAIAALILADALLLAPLRRRRAGRGHPTPVSVEA